MASLKPDTARPGTALEPGVPRWVLEYSYASLFADWPDGLERTADALSTAMQARRAAAEGWCADHGLSYCRTVLGWQQPAPSEIAAGCVLAPADLEE